MRASDESRRTQADFPWPLEALRARLGEAVPRAIRSTRAGGLGLVSVTVTAPAPIDSSAAVCAARATGDSWFCFEQPGSQTSMLAALGAVAAVEAAGADRFADVARWWASLAAGAVRSCEQGPPGSGLIAVGGFAFASSGAFSPQWVGFAPASFVVPEVSLCGNAERTWLTVNATVTSDDPVEAVLDRMWTALYRLRPAALPLLDPSPTEVATVWSPLAPAHYEAAVARAVERIRAGEMKKVVLAREVCVRAPSDYDPAAVLGVLRDASSSSYVFAVGRGDATFIGATPELLIRREGQRATTVALAGSTRRSADPAVDDHLGEALLRSEKNGEENAIVASRLVRSLRPHAIWVAAAPDPVVIKVANIQHLARPIRAQLASRLSVIDLVAHLHPTPAVGAEPREALAMISALEGIDRGWYAGPVGWTDINGDGEFCVGLRSALVRGRQASCYAGCGIVADSDPAAELAESELKLGVMLPALTG